MWKKKINQGLSLITCPVDGFSLLGLLTIGLVLWAVLLAAVGLFYKTFLWLYLAPSLIFLAAVFFRYWRRHKVFRKQYWVVLALIILSIVIVSLTTPSLFSGRDQGALAEAAIRLVQTGHLGASFPVEREFFEIYGPGTALNFPGFNYTATGRLVSQFPLGYSSFLAVGYIFFGPKGFAVMNGLALALFFLTFYALLRRWLSARGALAAIAFIGTNFIFWWFPKFTLSENLALFLTWFFVFQFMRFWKSEDRAALGLSFLSLLALLTVRIEGWAFLLLALILLAVKYRRHFRRLRKIIGPTGGKMLIATLVFLALITWAHSDFYWVILKGLIKPFLNHASANGQWDSFFWQIWYLIKVFFVYAIFYIILLGLIGVVRLIRHRDWDNLVPFWLLSPSLFYLVFPSISLDQPWMFRRFMFAVIPLMAFYAILFLSQLFKNKSYFLPLIVLLVSANIAVTAPLAVFVPDRTLLGQVSELSKTFRNTDLILVDRLASGDPWSMIAGPLNFFNGKQAVYFFNLNDLDKIHREKFTKTYFIIPDNAWDNYAGLQDRLTPVKDYTFTLYRLSILPITKSDLKNQAISFPRVSPVSLSGKIYLFN